MSSNDVVQVLLTATARILSPLVKILLRHGVSYAAFSEVAKRVYVDIADKEFAIPGKPQTTSRLSTMTGLSRKDVARLQAQPDWRATLDMGGVNRAARVISGWVRDAAYHDADGNPADLPFDGETGSFSALVRQYSGDITPRTIADELTRVGAISVGRDGRIRLAGRAYVPSAGVTEKLTILGSDVADLIATIDHNLSAEPDKARFQRKVAYSHIPAAKAEELKAALEAQAQHCLESMDRMLASLERRQESKAGAARTSRLGVGIYYFEEEQ